MGFYLALLFFSVAFLFPSLSFAQVVINEILPNPVGEDKGNEWIELFNTDITGIDVSGYKLKDAADNEQIINSGFLPPKSWLIIRSEGKFALNNSGSETIYLYDDLAKDPVSSLLMSVLPKVKVGGGFPTVGRFLEMCLFLPREQPIKHQRPSQLRSQLRLQLQHRPRRRLKRRLRSKRRFRLISLKMRVVVN